MTDPITVGWLALAGLLALLYTGHLIIPVAMWITPVILLHASRSSRTPLAVLGAWVVLGIATAITNRGVLPMSGPGYVATAFALPLTLTLALLADRLVATRLAGLASTLVFPLAWVAFELARTRLTSGGSWNSPAYTQAGNLPLMQLTSITGLSGIVFLIGWFASVVNHVWDRGWTVEAGRAVLLPYAVVTGLVLALGALRVARARTDDRTIRVATISYPREQFVRGEVTRFKYDAMSAEEAPAMHEKVALLHARYLDETRREARAGAALVVWPEENLIISGEDEPAFLDSARALARNEHIHLLMGMATVTHGAPRPLQNKAVLVTPEGEIAFVHHKSRLVSGVEDQEAVPGDGRLPVAETALGRMTAAICFELDFPELIREAGRAGADVLLAPSNDWLAIKQLHLSMAVVRAIENGVSMVRATSTGISAVVDPVGRIRAFSDDFAPDGRTLVARLPTRGVRTLYAKVGDLFAWLCVGGLAASSLAAFATRIR